MIVQKWHGWVNQPKFSRQWHEQDVADELKELQESYSLINHLSELSDVVYTVTRARYSGHALDFPLRRWQVALGFVYMYPKYTSRTLFFRRAGRKAGASRVVQSVRNPKKTHKLEAIAAENNLDPDKFKQACEALAKYWPLLP